MPAFSRVPGPVRRATSVPLSGARATSRGFLNPSRIPGGRTPTRGVRSWTVYTAGSLRNDSCAEALETHSPVALAAIQKIRMATGRRLLGGAARHKLGNGL